MGSWLQDHVVRLCFNLWKTAKLPSIPALPLCAPMTMSGSSRFSTSFQHLVLSLSWVLDSLICIYRSISLVLFLGIGSHHPLSNKPGSPRKRPPLQLKCPDKGTPYSCASWQQEALARTWIWLIWMQVVTESSLHWLGSDLRLLGLVSLKKIISKEVKEEGVRHFNPSM